MKKLFAVLPLGMVLFVGPAVAQDVVLFKAKVLQQDFLSGYDVPQPQDAIIIVEGGIYRLRLGVERVLIGDVPEQTVTVETGLPGQLDPDPPKYLYVLARKSPRGAVTVISWRLADRGLCFDEDWKALGIAAEWRTQSTLQPCTDQ